MSDGATIAESYFLSYSRSDEQVALRFARDLRAAGIAMWVDQLDIRPSEHWDRAIERAVRECRGLVVILSPRSAASDNVADEISFAIDHGKSVLPVMIERCGLPLRITRMQLVDATGNYERALEQCLAALRGISEAPQPATPAQPPMGSFDAELIADAKAQLTQILGPIASLLVDREALRASSPSELFSLLAEHVENAKDREQLLKSSGVPACSPSGPESSEALQSVPAAEIDRLSVILAHYLGPMAAMIARRESSGARSPAELKQRLASRIPHERERTDFLSRAENP
ncbi:MAG TPA: toll/interleukin-1 receptor domain-containing protein [Sphingomicrobium sp.]|nr:toll/interleukin-1 receptor domain-containing protein [Sphingomicrobium sp.]